MFRVRLSFGITFAALPITIQFDAGVVSGLEDVARLLALAAREAPGIRQSVHVLLTEAVWIAAPVVAVVALVRWMRLQRHGDTRGERGPLS